MKAIGHKDLRIFTNMTKNLLLIQGIYTSVTGVWPLIHMRSFLYVTGPKTDLWLVKTVSLLLVCMGLSFIVASGEKEGYPLGIILLSIASALSLTGIDFFYSLTGVISKIYLLDAFIQILFILTWLIIGGRYFLRVRF